VTVTSAPVTPAPAVADDTADPVAAARRIAADIAAAHADDVDRAARFPAETVAALRSARLLAALIPTEYGGLDASLAEVSRCTTALARHCGTSALIFAMHQSQVASLVRHADTEPVRAVIRAIASGGLLVASATTEARTGGDVRRSGCHVERDGDRFRLSKQAPVISYGAYADIVLATARRDADSAAHEQALVICPRAGLVLEETGGWDTLGFRGTCSNGYLLTAEGSTDLVMTVPYARISAETMLPVSHLLWASAWLGLAEEALDRARRAAQSAVRANPAVTPPGATRLAEAMPRLSAFRTLVSGGIERFEALSADPSSLARPSSVIEFNNVKVAASTMVVEIVTAAMAICGIAGYRRDSPVSLDRILRDAFGAGVMVNNDRIHGNTAALLLVSKAV
jgi:acyl-CoA dehydrogenase